MALGFDYNIESEKALPFYALLNLDKKHEVSWLSLEHKKPGHIVGNKSMVIVQMQPEWSENHYLTSQEELVEIVVKKVE